MDENLERKIIEQLSSLNERMNAWEKNQEAFETRNMAEHQAIIARINELKSDSKNAEGVNNAQNERLTELETAFAAHIEEETKDRNSYMWRFGIIVTLAIFGADMITKFIH